MKVQKKEHGIDRPAYEEDGDIIVAVMRVRHGYEEKKGSLEVFRKGKRGCREGNEVEVRGQKGK